MRSRGSSASSSSWLRRLRGHGIHGLLGHSEMRSWAAAAPPAAPGCGAWRQYTTVCSSRCFWLHATKPGSAAGSAMQAARCSVACGALTHAMTSSFLGGKPRLQTSSYALPTHGCAISSQCPPGQHHHEQQRRRRRRAHHHHHEHPRQPQRPPLPRPADQQRPLAGRGTAGGRRRGAGEAGNAMLPGAMRGYIAAGG